MHASGVSIQKFSARRAVIVLKPQVSSWGLDVAAVASERRFLRKDRISLYSIYSFTNFALDNLSLIIHHLSLTSMIHQSEFRLNPLSRGCHLITGEISP